MTIEIFDQSTTASGSFLRVKLLDILDVLEPEARGMQWSIFDLEARTSPDSGIHMLDLEAEVSRSGKHLTFDALRDLAARFSQVVNGVFCGCAGRQCSPPDLTDAELRTSCDIAVIAHDSSVWIVHARDQAVIDRLQNRFQAARLVD
jgi:hypothetical protein